MGTTSGRRVRPGMLKVKGRQSQGTWLPQGLVLCWDTGIQGSGGGVSVSAAISPLSWGLWSTGHPSTQQGLGSSGLYHICLVAKREVALHPRDPPRAGWVCISSGSSTRTWAAGEGRDEQTEARGPPPGRPGLGPGDRTDRSDDTPVQPRFEAGSGRLGWNRDWVLGAVHLGGIWWKPEVCWGTRRVQDDGVPREFGGTRLDSPEALSGHSRAWCRPPPLCPTEALPRPWDYFEASPGILSPVPRGYQVPPGSCENL